MFSFELEKSSAGGVMVTNPRFLPTYVQFEEENKNYRVTPMRDLTDDDLPDVEVHLNEVEAI
ncbi:hypothetical protein [Bacillus sp. JCM 19041]|uniref:hypothetical protein n=1 Tax=Bacillus sp. JCM 19041 TaxID=1460637 RepID=UPI0006D184D9